MASRDEQLTGFHARLAPMESLIGSLWLMLNNSIDELSASRVKNRFVAWFTSSIAASIAAVRFNILHSAGPDTTMQSPATRTKPRKTNTALAGN